jgi:hypothetical protein
MGWAASCFDVAFQRMCDAENEVEDLAQQMAAFKWWQVWRVIVWFKLWHKLLEAERYMLSSAGMTGTSSGCKDY